ncbi:MAG: sigma-70 family RNA polymerase sigma factor [Nibricoccus sp.]
MTDDAELLSRYAETRSEPAFAQIVERHLGMVYHAALRQLGGDAHRANDVAQAVFVLLAEKANQLRGHPSLAGWLHTTTRFKVREWMRESARRNRREAEAHAMSEQQQTPSHDEEWAKLRPVIDDVLAELNPDDREAVLLRFFEGKSFAEIGERLKLTQTAAHRRVERALEKTRARLTRRGIASTTVLAGALGTQAGLAAPAGLSASVVAATSTVTIAPAAMSVVATFTLMATSKIMMGTAALVIAGASVVLVSQQRAESVSRDTLASAQAQSVDWEARLKAERERLETAEKARRELEEKYEAQRRAYQDQVKAKEESTIQDGTELMKEYPELREALLEGFRASMRNTWGPLLAELGLSEEQIIRFLDLRIGNAAYVVGGHHFVLFPKQPGQPPADQEMKTLLGDSGYERYRDYKKGITAQEFTQELIGSLYQTEAPLTRQQTEAIQRIVRDSGASGNWEYSLPEKGWVELRAYAEKSLSSTQRAALDRMQAGWALNKETQSVVRAYTNAVKNGEVKP